MNDSRLSSDATSDLRRRAAIHAALGEPARLALVEELTVSDRSPTELATLLGLGSNLLAHHLDVLEAAGVVRRSSSAGDGRRKYVRLAPGIASRLLIGGRPPRGEMLFLCTHNSARSQLAAAMWSSRTGEPASSAGTTPAKRVHRGAIAAARRAGLSLEGATPQHLSTIPESVQVVTVCDRAHEQLVAKPDWWHWSIADPAVSGNAAAFDTVVEALESRIDALVRMMNDRAEVKQ